MAFSRHDQPVVVQTLMVSLTLIMRDELTNPCPQRALTEEDPVLGPRDEYFGPSSGLGGGGVAVEPPVPFGGLG